jgi:uncharacterized repeat protein (TIGR03833 family)
MNNPNMQRSSIRPGMAVLVVLKQDQATGRLTQGIVKDILTRSASHPHGIKVRLQNGLVGRVQKILDPAPEDDGSPPSTQMRPPSA